MYHRYITVLNYTSYNLGSNRYRPCTSTAMQFCRDSCGKSEEPMKSLLILPITDAPLHYILLLSAEGHGGSDELSGPVNYPSCILLSAMVLLN